MGACEPAAADAAWRRPYLSEEEADEEPASVRKGDKPTKAEKKLLREQQKEEKKRQKEELKVKKKETKDLLRLATRVQKALLSRS